MLAAGSCPASQRGGRNIQTRDAHYKHRRNQFAGSRNVAEPRIELRWQARSNRLSPRSAKKGSAKK
jgi:hypothetical protein